MLVIHLKQGPVIEIPKFEKVSYLVRGEIDDLIADEFDGFYIQDSYTYNFQGSSCISVKGNEILFIELQTN